MIDVQDPYQQGYLSGFVDDLRSSCRYDVSTIEHQRWNEGYDVGNARRKIMNDLETLLPEDQCQSTVNRAERAPRAWLLANARSIHRRLDEA